MASSSGSPCAACKFLRRKCMPECVFAPYFPPEEPQKFANVHKVFGASNVSKLLNDLPASHREDAIRSLAFEAEARVKDPVYGCVGALSILHRQIQHLQKELAAARTDISRHMARIAAGQSLLPSSNPIQTNQAAEQLLEYTRFIPGNDSPYDSAAALAVLGLTQPANPQEMHLAETPANQTGHLNSQHQPI